MSDFAKTMRDWKRLCDSIEKKLSDDCYDDCCKNCPLYMFDCGGIFEMPDNTDWRLLEKRVDAWAAENPEPQYPTWAEWLKSVGVLPVDQTLFHTGLKQPIPADIAEKLGLKPNGGNGNG